MATQSARPVANDASYYDNPLRKSVISKLNRKIIVYAFICFCINYLDRVNLGFAALHMNQQLGFTPYIFGLGAGIFFLGYMAFEVPSNLMLDKFGPRIWLARIMVSWGIVSCGMAFIQTPTSFYIMRFLLGVAEAGFAPGILLYLTYWFPAKERGKAVSYFMVATVFSIIIGAPLSGWIMEVTHGVFGLEGWQLMFIVEGLPAVALGIFTFFYLIDRPEKDTKWLTPEERQWLITQLNSENQDRAAASKHKLSEVFSDYRVWLLTIVYMFNGIAVYGVIMWLPQIVKAMGNLTVIQTGFITAIPYIFAALGLIVVSRHSDKTGERKFHTAIGGLIGGIFLALSSQMSVPLMGLALLCICAFFMWSYMGVFWTLPPQFLQGTAAAAGIAAINGFAQIGGFAGPYLIGYVKTLTDSFNSALLVLAIFPVIGSLICMTLKAQKD